MQYASLFYYYLIIHNTTHIMFAKFASKTILTEKNVPHVKKLVYLYTITKIEIHI